MEPSHTFMIIYNLKKNNIMKRYKIEFRTLDGNINYATLDARSETDAEMKFDEQYQYDEIISVSEDDQYARGGKLKSIPNKYEGHTAKEVWEAWDAKQRMHFIKDHGILEKIENQDDVGILISGTYFNELHDEIKQAIAEHIAEGQYAHGGKLSNKSQFKFKEHTDVELHVDGRKEKDFFKKGEAIIGELLETKRGNLKIKSNNGIYYVDEDAVDIIPITKHKINNQYEGHTAKEVWEAWSPLQRYHFMNDHSDSIDDFTTGMVVDYMEEDKYSNIPKSIQLAVQQHIDNGQYAGGGKVEGSGWGNFRQGERVTTFDNIKVGDILLYYNKRFNSKNIVRITDMRENDYVNEDGIKIVNGKFVDPEDITQTRKWASERGFSIWYHQLESEEYYLPLKEYAHGGTTKGSSVKHKRLGEESYIIGQRVLYKRKMYDGTPETRWVHVDEKNGKKGISWYVNGAGSISDNSFFHVPNWETEVIPADKVTEKDLSYITYGYARGGTPGEKYGYRVFNYTDNIYASPDIFEKQKGAKAFIAEFRNRYKAQGYYRTNRHEKIDINNIDLEIIPANFNPFNGKYENEAITFKTGGLTRAKARQMLHEGTAHGHPLTESQRGYFGAVASGTAKANKGGIIQSAWDKLVHWLNSPI